MSAYLVKKYANRKLYDTVERRYVTLDTVAGLLQQGNNVQVVDQTSGDDITATTLAQLNGSKRSTRAPSLTARSRRAPRKPRSPRTTRAQAPRTTSSSPSLKGMFERRLAGERLVDLV